MYPLKQLKNLQLVSMWSEGDNLIYMDVAYSTPTAQLNF